MKVLIIDDDPDILEIVSLVFTVNWHDWQVATATTGEGGLDLIESEHPDVVLLDVRLPDVDGFEVCRQIRSFSDVPILMLTARDSEADKVRGLELGADDYLTKPFSHLELLARVRAVLRRAAMPLPTSVGPDASVGELTINFARHEVTRDGARVNLTPTEYSLLYHLVRNAGQVMPHATLLAKVWGHEYVEEADYLKVYIGRLRAKIEEDPRQPRLILTERGVGYRFIKD
jgi:two-component system, OmpR family, KDP operon response regulator KdpE